MLGRHTAIYRRCVACRLITTQATWLGEAYSEAITKTDVGLVHRNLHYATKISAIAHGLLEGENPVTCLDFGAGYGLLVRLLRDRGINCNGYDVHCKSIFAERFTYTMLPTSRVDFVSAIEVLEHMENPHDLFGLLNTITDTLVFSTELQPSESPLPGNWWYYCLEHGQHISLYHYETLSALAAQYGARLYSRGSLHIVTRKKLSLVKVWFLLRHKFALIYTAAIRDSRQGLTSEDYAKSKADLLAANEKRNP